MAITVINKGFDPKDQLYRHTCKPCGTVVEFKMDDLKYNSDQRDGDFHSYNCPVCREYHSFANGTLEKYKYNPLGKE